MAITQEFDLNLIPDQEPVVVHVSQYDIGAGRLIAHLYDGDLAYTPTAGATVTIQGTKPDHYGFMYDATLSGNTVTADLTEQMCAVAGRTVVNIIVLESDNRTGTFNFFLDVQKAALGNDTVISASDGSILDIPELVESAEEYAENAEAWANGTRNGVDVPSTDQTYHKNAKYYAETSGDNVEESEAWAKGTKNGVAVPSTDPTYHNNSKYYSEQAGDYVEDAEAWAVGERGGTAVPSTDDTYHNNSKYYAEKAENSADHAADIVNDANYLIGVDPTAIGNPQTPYLRPSDVVDNLTSTATDKPLSAKQGKVLKDALDQLTPPGQEIKTQKFNAYSSSSLTTQGVTIPANSWGTVYIQFPTSTANVILMHLNYVEWDVMYEFEYKMMMGGVVKLLDNKFELNIYNGSNSSYTVNYVGLTFADK